MPYTYQVWYNQPCLDYLATLPKSVRSRLFTWIQSLEEDFNREGDYSVRGSEDRDWQVAIISSHAVVWWVDHPAGEIKIISVRRTQR